MARRFPLPDIKTGLERPAHSSATSTGFIKLQPNRHKADKSWWSQAAGTGESGRASSDDSSVFHHSDDRANEKLLHTTLTATPSSESSPFGHLFQHTNLSNHTSLFRRTEDTLLSMSGGVDGTEGARDPPNEHYSQLFGRLPDPIHLQEQMGEFDGQVVFIGHPNRDVSAHQWSTLSFQWENVGRYAHTRGKIEGLLASDPLEVTDTPHNSLQYFKLAAEAREKQIVEHGRPKEYGIGSTGEAPADVDEKAPLSSVLDKFNQGSVTVVRNSGLRSFSSRAQPPAPLEFRATVKEDHLDDPFVASASSPKLGASPNFHSKTGLNATGSLDFGYQFPPKSITLKTPVSAFTASIMSSQNIWKDVERLNASYSDSNSVSKSDLREVAFGEEAACGFPGTSDHDRVATKTPIYSSLEDYQNRQKLRSKLVEFGEQATQTQTTAQRRITIPTLATTQPSIRSLFPPPGLTVANPHRVPSNLNATAPPYVSKATPSPTSEVSTSDVTTNTTVTSVGLRSSDPVSSRRKQTYEVANGLGQQAPTKQTFTGPFFTDSKPSAHDPTAALSIQIGEEEKLVAWFRDGQRPSRQREYANTLVSSAMASNRGRDFGAIGEKTNKLKLQDHENTGLFVRLYENMSEYGEESRSGRTRNYFTRAWKPAHRQQRALGAHDDNSYFEHSYAATQGRRKSYLEPNERSWGGLGLTANLTRARFPQGTPIGGSRGERCRVNIF